MWDQRKRIQNLGASPTPSRLHRYFYKLGPSPLQNLYEICSSQNSLDKVLCQFQHDGVYGFTSTQCWNFDNMLFGGGEEYIRPKANKIASIKCKRWNCSDKKLFFKFLDPRVSAPPQFCTNIGPSASRKPFNCFWMTEIGQSIFELCECKEKDGQSGTTSCFYRPCR